MRIMIKNSIIDDFKTICPECNGKVISIPEKGDTVCCRCGLVILERNIDNSHSGIRAFTKRQKEQRERTGSPISVLLPDMALCTIIDKRNIRNADLKRAAKWNSRMTWNKKNILIATTDIKRISHNLNLPIYITKTAIKLYLEAFKKKLLRGRSIKGMVAACLYFACRDQQIPRTFQEVLEETSVNAKKVRMCYRVLIRELRLKMPSTDPISLIPRYIVELGLDATDEKAAIEILNAFIASSSTCGKDPKGFCAGALYFVSKMHGKKVSQSKISNLLGITEVTLRSRYKEMMESSIILSKISKV